MDSNEALAKLKEGNSRYVAGRMAGKDLVKRRGEVASGQQPFASIVSCSDSRVVPEYIFDADIGEVFIVRSAGNVVDAIGIGSVEYGCEHLHTPLLVVLGHEGCGAVKATCECKGECDEGHIKDIVNEVKGAAAAKGYSLNESIEENIRCVIAKIRQKSEIVAHLEKEGKLKVVGAHYSLTSGIVKFI